MFKIETFFLFKFYLWKMIEKKNNHHHHHHHRSNSNLFESRSFEFYCHIIFAIIIYLWNISSSFFWFAIMISIYIISNVYIERKTKCLCLSMHACTNTNTNIILNIYHRNVKKTNQKTNKTTTINHVKQKKWLIDWFNISM